MQVESDAPSRSPKPRLPVWAKIGLAALVIGILFAVAMTRRPGEFSDAFLVCAMPFALLITFIAFIASAGKRSRRLCGFCGYDRTGLARESLCPECGQPFTENAPGYKPVGKRALPFWIWVPALLCIPAMLLVRFAGDLGGHYLIGCLIALGLILLAGAAQAWRQAR